MSGGLPEGIFPLDTLDPGPPTMCLWSPPSPGSRLCPCLGCIHPQGTRETAGSHLHVTNVAIPAERECPSPVILMPHRLHPAPQPGPGAGGGAGSVRRGSVSPKPSRPRAEGSFWPTANKGLKSIQLPCSRQLHELVTRTRPPAGAQAWTLHPAPGCPPSGTQPPHRASAERSPGDLGRRGQS